MIVPKNGINKTLLLGRGWTPEFLAKLTPQREKKAGRDYTYYLESEVETIEQSPEFQNGLDDRLDEYEEKETEKNLETWEELGGFPFWAESVAAAYPANEVVLVPISPKIDFSQGFRELSDSNGSLGDKHMKIYDFVWEADDAGWAVFYNYAVSLDELEEDEDED